MKRERMESACEDHRGCVCAVVVCGVCLMVSPEFSGLSGSAGSASVRRSR